MSISLLRHFYLVVVFIFCQSIGQSQSEEPLGLLGDNFSLHSTLEVFKNSYSLESFEKAINNESNQVHNLDLNDDGNIDYITINDYQDEEIHIVILSANISNGESQDIAVIEIEKTGDKNATLQIIGDEDLYGQGMIVEPYNINGTSESQGPNADMTFDKIVLNVWLWPSVRYVFSPTYVVYRSPWRWSHYPRWWSPWRPKVWSVWRPLSIRYAPRYRITPVRRIAKARSIYTPYRRVSKTVTIRHKVAIADAKNRSVQIKKSSTIQPNTKMKNGETRNAQLSKRKINNSGKKVTTTTTEIKKSSGKKKVSATRKTKKKTSQKQRKKTVKKTKKLKNKDRGRS